MIVTNVEEVTKAKSKVYIDGEYAFILYRKEISRYRIAAGAKLDETLFHKIRKEVVEKRAKLRALHLLNDMGRTEQQLRQKLEGDGYPEDILEEAVSYVKSFGYVDDGNYARLFIDSRKNKKSRAEIYASLLHKGISTEEIEQAFEESYDEDDAKKAIAAILKKKDYDPRKADKKETQKIFGYLARKGFKREDIFSVSEMLDIYDKTV